MFANEMDCHYFVCPECACVIDLTDRLCPVHGLVLPELLPASQVRQAS